MKNQNEIDKEIKHRLTHEIIKNQIFNDFIEPKRYHFAMLSESSSLLTLFFFFSKYKNLTLIVIIISLTAIVTTVNINYIFPKNNYDLLERLSKNRIILYVIVFLSFTLVFLLFSDPALRIAEVITLISSAYMIHLSSSFLKYLEKNKYTYFYQSKN